MWIHTPADIQMETHKHTFAGFFYTDVCALAQHEYVFLRNQKWVHKPYTRMAHTVQRIDTPSHTKHCLWQMLAGILPGRKLFHFFLFSLYFGMPISVHSVAMSPKLCFFSLSLSLPVPLSTFLFFFFFPYVIIMKLKSFVPREIRGELGKSEGDISKDIFVSNELTLCYALG